MPGRPCICLLLFLLLARATDERLRVVVCRRCVCCLPLSSPAPPAQQPEIFATYRKINLNNLKFDP